MENNSIQMGPWMPMVKICENLQLQTFAPQSEELELNSSASRPAL